MRCNGQEIHARISLRFFSKRSGEERERHASGRPQFGQQRSLTTTKIRHVDEEPPAIWVERWQVRAKAYRRIMVWNKLYGISIAKHAKRWTAISSLVR